MDRWPIPQIVTGNGIRFAGALGIMLSLATMPAGAIPFTLADQNSSATFNFEAGAASGMTGWSVDGVNQLSQQWFWCRVDGVDNREYGLENLSLVGLHSIDTNPFVDDRDDALSALWRSPDLFDVSAFWGLRGGAPGAGVSDVSEIITITNTSSSSLSFHFFQYSNFDLNGVADDQFVAVNPDRNVVTQTGGGPVMNQTSVLAGAGRAEAALFPGTFSKLTDLDADDLDGSRSATGDVTWAFQWDVVLAPGGSFQISADNQIVPVPEPHSVLLAVGGLAFLARRRICG